LSQNEWVSASAPAKVNLHFGVGETRVDGFHDVVSVYQELDLREYVSVRLSEVNRIEVLGTIDERQLALVPKSDSNLVSKAGRMVARFAEADDTNFEFEIFKRVPVAGGMAGGSADAAAALVACNQLLQTSLSREKLIRESVELGSDVPFAILGGTAIGLGRGENLKPVELGATLHFVMILNSAGLSTPEVYAELDRQREEAGLDPRQMPTPLNPDALLDALRIGDVRKVAANIHNDLQSAALTLLPELELTISAAERYGAIRAFVSGSGPTVAAIVETADDATALAVALQHANFNAFPVQSDARGTILEPNEQ
jgi:4-diphosphocytidyl-2-C-methyl-D-erythritol kinase